MEVRSREGRSSRLPPFFGVFWLTCRGARGLARSLRKRHAQYDDCRAAISSKGMSVSNQ